MHVGKAGTQRAAQTISRAQEHSGAGELGSCFAQLFRETQQHWTRAQSWPSGIV
jgi:hypothetical protein